MTFALLCDGRWQEKLCSDRPPLLHLLRNVIPGYYFTPDFTFPTLGECIKSRHSHSDV